MRHLESLTAGKLLSISRPELLFTGMPFEAKQEYRALASRWHPDHTRESNAPVVFAHIVNLYQLAQQKLSNGSWIDPAEKIEEERPGIKKFRLLDGSIKAIDYIASRNFELGEMYIADHQVVYEVRDEYSDLYRNGRAQIKALKFGNHKMAVEMAKFLPRITGEFRTKESRVLVIHKTPDQLLLADVLAHAAGASPHSAGASPHSAGASPHSAGASPHSAGESPHSTGASPHCAGSPPHSTDAPPHFAGSPPHSTGASPHFAGALIPVEHIGWILNVLYNIACYFEWQGLAHNAISPETVFVSPLRHTGMLLGGWWYAAPFGENMTALPDCTLQFIRQDVIEAQYAHPSTDLELIKAIGREILGDASGMRLCLNDRLPEEIVHYLQTDAGESATKEYAHWKHGVLPSVFGAPKFVHWNLNSHTLYKEK